MRVQSVLECTSKAGKKYYEVVLEGKGKTIAWEPGIKIGDEIDDSRVVQNKNGDGWIIQSKGQSFNRTGYQRNDGLIIRQVAFKGMIDLVVAGKMDAKQMSSQVVDTLSGYIQPLETHAEAPKSPPPAPQSDFNLQDVLACDWSTFEKKDYDVALGGLAKFKHLKPEEAKAFLVEKFGIESSSMIPRGRRNEVIKELAALC